MKCLIPILPLSLVLFTITAHVSEGRLILVGGSVSAWNVPENPTTTLTHWAEKNRFQVGDIFVWKYDAKLDSVLQVTKEDFENCNTAKPLKEYKDGDTKVTLGISGPYFFISGASTGNCVKGEKVTLVVQSPNHKVAPKPAPGAASWPAAAPKGNTSPAHAPAPAPAPGPSSAGTGLVVGNGFLWVATLVAVILVFA